MRRNATFALAAFVAAAILACSGESSSPPATGPAVRGEIVGSETTVRSLIDVVFVDDGLKTAANSQFSDLVALKTAGDLAGARAKALDLIKFITNKANKGRLTTDGEKVADLIAAIRLYVGLAPAFVDPAAAGPDGGVGIVGPEGGYVFAGPADNPTGFFKALPASGTTPATFPTPTIVELIPLAPANYPANANIFNSPYPTYPRYFEIKALSSVDGSPVQLSAPANVGICVITLGSGPGLGVYGAPESIHGSRLHLGHKKTDGTFDPLVQLGQDASLPCLPETYGALDRSAPWYAPGNLGRSILNALSPTSAYAGHGGTIAQTTSISPFFIYDVGPSAVGFTPSSLVAGSGGVTFQPIDASGNIIQSVACTNFATSNLSVGSFDGVPFYPSNPGTTTITADCAPVGSALFVPQQVSQVVTIVSANSPTSLSMMTGGVAQLLAPAGTASWSSSNASVATVSSTGAVTSVAAGAGTIYALDGNAGILQQWPLNTATFDNYPRVTIAAWPLPASFAPASSRIVVEYCSTGSSDPATCTSWATQYSQILSPTTSSYTFSFVGKQAGRWHIDYFDEIGVQVGSTGYQTFVYAI